MPPAPASPDKPLQRRRRKQRNTDISQPYPNGLTDEAASRQTKSDLDLPVTEMESPPTPPTTDARPVQDDSTPVHVSWPSKDTGQRKNTPRKNRNSLPNGSPRLQNVSSTPRPAQRPISLTPGKKTTTPSRAYAGPTFHASPAASSLPIPKFYSKSVPDVNKASSMQTAMKEAAELSSDHSEDSPTPGFAQRVGEEQAREESPLDIFFKADREQRERQRLEQRVSAGGQDLPSGKPVLDQPRHHSRHPTTDSHGELFPMELENKEPTKVSHEKAFSDPTTGGSVVERSGPSQSVDTVETPEQAAQRKAKTVALKHLLMCSIPQAADAASSARVVSKSTATDHDLPSLHPKIASNPQVHRQVAVLGARQLSPGLRPSSSLRREVSASAPPENEHMPELPATPTPLRTRSAHKSAPPQGQRHPPLDAPASAAQSPPTVQPAVSPFKNMEDDLRRMLKMNDVPSSTTRVRS
ncbi:MAG: hypothetical protein Q9182_003500 [Xanthomendoza sp. 2 TL-2023]